MTTASSRATDEISALYDGWVAAIRGKDLSGALSHYSPDVVAFDLINPLQYKGVDAVKKRLQQWFASFSGPLGYDVRDIQVSAGEDVAFSHSLNHVQATTNDGKPLDMWWRATLCYRKVGKEWLVTHSHTSVPFDMSTGAASFDLKP
jgi:uncharacterized protein (TIGR02246 family)